MWFLLLLLHTAHIEAVIAQGKSENRLILKNGSNPCEGYIEIYIKGERGHVGEKYWSQNTDKVVCRSTHCGEPVKDSTTETAPWPTEPVLLNEVNCTGKEKHLWECPHPGFKVSSHRTGTRKKIECSNKIKISLDGFKCAGAVKYSTDGGQTDSGYFCGDTGWGKKEADFLCKNLKCGTSKETSNNWMDERKFTNPKTINCSDLQKIDNLWQCVTEESRSCNNPASVICTGHDKLRLKGNASNVKGKASNVCSGRLEKEENGEWNPVKKNTNPDVWCQQMHCGMTAHSWDNGTLTCTDNVTVVLMDNNKPSTCYGEVHIQVNGQSRAVCDTTWTKKEAEVVCRELNCGSMISYQKNDVKTFTREMIMDNVNCFGDESSLWHCKAKRYNNRVQCSSVAYVVCAGSIEVDLFDGPGKCAGRVEIQHEGKWHRVNEVGWISNNSDAVCKQLNCGRRRDLTTPEKFSQGSNDFLRKTVKCNSDAKHISECLPEANSPVPTKNLVAVGITCEEHKVVFLKGDNSCSGLVGIEHGPKTYWLSGSNETWDQNSANTVCRQMHCGNASNHISISRPDLMKDVWNVSYSCLSNSTSLLDCENTTPPSNHGDTIATVTCSGKIEVKLTNECWGYVNVCADGECGGVCADTWTDQKSVMLCENLGCGDISLVPNPKANTKESKVLFKGLHTTNHMTNLSQSNFIKNENDYICKPRQAYVVCSGSVKSKFSSSRDKCSGNVLVEYEGQWLPVCNTALENINTQKAICGEQCGPAGKPIPYFGPESTEGRVISEINCGKDKKSITACNVTTSSDSCLRGGLQCSNWRKMALTGGMACSGAVAVHSKNRISAVSTEGWTEKEGEMLCQNLECGNFMSNRTTTSGINLITSFSCAGVKNPENIWECEKQTSDPQKQLFLKCQDEPTITLNNTCHGEVKINDIAVCITNWTDKYSDMVCQENNCGDAIAGISGDKSAKANGKYYHVSCEDNHYDLGQCKRFEEKCKEKLVSVYCFHNVELRTTEKCGGQIEVSYGLGWKKVCPLKSFSKKHKEMLCKELRCGSLNESITNNKKEALKLETSLECTEHNQDIRYCVKQRTCTNVQPAEIYCGGYVPIPTINPDPPPPNILPIILGVGFLLVLVILIVVFVRICIVKKAKKKAMNFSSRKLSRTEVEFESGDYEDVKDNEMEDFSLSRFKSETEVITENDAQSTSSFPYDDIDEAQPLTAQAATDADSRDDIKEGDPDESTDGVTYEVEDPQENYDDIEAYPEITQTEAEVHNSPQTTPESDAKAPQGLVQGDEDYLVPGQDG
ncbi:scavenger receptor cysteine-rich type 1 protein M160-like [Sander lucioperca]|uniref:scavenger receptor cysteine-rich type 1 protein M160-like n=1 Tax=Sander lucioperca TaxID=283035 RepID=UPI0016534520|nr:scavenger receptor cysteine-rich type 1 protein M160-like [Sander lucioperca]